MLRIEENRRATGASALGPLPAVAQPVADGGQFLEDGGAVLAGVRLLVGFVPEVLQLDVEMIGAEDIAEPEESRPGRGCRDRHRRDSPPRRGGSR